MSWIQSLDIIYQKHYKLILLKQFKILVKLKERFLQKESMIHLRTVSYTHLYIIKKAKELGLLQAYHFENNQELIQYLDEFIDEDDVILVKGSNGMHLKDVVEHLKERL